VTANLSSYLFLYIRVADFRSTCSPVATPKFPLKTVRKPG
jgi:hypothetical protein